MPVFLPGAPALSRAQTNPFDERISALLLILVIALAWNAMTTSAAGRGPKGELEANAAATASVA